MVKLYHGGGLDAAIAKYGGEKKHWRDLSTGINPTAFPISELEFENWGALPDENAMQKLLEAAGSFFGVTDVSHMVAGNGTQALIERLPDVLRCKEIAIISPTYNEHANCWKKAGAEIHTIAAGAPVPENCDCLVVVNPNNPDGHLHSIDELKVLETEMANRGGYLIIDEAFCDVMPEKSFVPFRGKNTIIFRSFGKFFGLAGIRLGFCILEDELAKQLGEQIGPWAVSTPALEIGLSAYSDLGRIKKFQEMLEFMSGEQAKAFEEVGLNVVGQTPLFIFVKHPKAYELYENLAKEFILVRHFPEKPEYLRFGICKGLGHLARLKTILQRHI